MAKLKAFITHSGFFELAVAAPSIKAAIEALGISAHAFKHGFAKQTQDASIVATVTATPGVVLRRPAGSTGKFAITAALPVIPSVRKAPNKKANSLKASVSSSAERAKNERQALIERAKADRAAKLRTKFVTIYEKAEKRHEAAMQKLNEERGQLAKRAEEEDNRWMKEKARLKAKYNS